MAARGRDLLNCCDSWMASSTERQTRRFGQAHMGQRLVLPDVKGLLIDRAVVAGSCEAVQQAVARGYPGRLQRLAAEPNVWMLGLAPSAQCPHRRI